MPTTARPGFRGLLVALQVGLVLLAVTAIAYAARSTYAALAREAGRQRLELAASRAEQALAARLADLDASARLLAERPTLARLLAAGSRAELATFLERFASTSGLAAAGVTRAAVGWAGAAGALDLGRLPAPASASAPRLERAGELPFPVAVATAALADDPAALAVTALALDADLTAVLHAAAGLPVELVASPLPQAPSAPDPWHPGHSGPPPLAATETSLVVERPLRAGDGSLVATLVVRARSEEVDAEVDAFTTRLRRLAWAVALLAGVLALAAGELLARPIGVLTGAARRIAGGDLATPVRAGGPRELALLGDTMDGMRRRLRDAQRDLADREAESRAVLAGIAEGVFAVDADRRITFLNPQAAGLVGQSIEAVVGRFCGDVLAPRRADGTRPCEDDCPILHARSRGTTRRLEHLDRAGLRRSVVITSAPPAVGEEAAGDGRQIQVIREESPEESDHRLRDTVMAHLSHELETPLAAQLASLELLRDHLDARPQDPQAATLIAALERGTLRLAQLVRNLLERARIEAGEASLRRLPLDLDAVVEEASEAIRPLLAQRRQRLEVELPQPLPRVTGDPERLVQVLVNLLGNANKFAPDDSTIRVGGEATQERVTLWVEDQGPGLPVAAGRELFRPFVRLPGRGPGQGGVGLGLAIVDSIIARHGGGIATESPPPGVTAPPGTPPGTRVTFWLPAHQIHGSDGNSDGEGRGRPFPPSREGKGTGDCGGDPIDHERDVRSPTSKDRGPEPAADTPTTAVHSDLAERRRRQ